MPEVAPAPATLPVDTAPRKLRLPAFSREIGLAALTLLIILLFSILYPYTFKSAANFNAILRNLAFEGILAIGMMLMLVGGVFDLSVGAMASMIGVITGWLMKNAGWPVPLAIVTGLLVAAAGGFLNGFIVAKVRVNALITTLGTMGVFQGVALLIGGPGITFLPESFTRFGQAEVGGIQAPVLVMLALAIIAQYCLAHTRFFRQYYYIGSNPKAAHLSGISVERLQMLSFTIMGTIAGLAGIVYASRIATATSTVGVGAELQAITAVILGGASLTGGKGTIWGALIGVFFMALMKNVLIISRVSSEWQGIILGAVLVLAVAVDSIMNRKKA
ncbi:MAG: ABC transporter permease [Verrucomicrobia subdivision 3 bacterium]|nr:ABC transporter permease [Limisphaerales bacterium]